MWVKYIQIKVVIEFLEDIKLKSEKGKGEIYQKGNSGISFGKSTANSSGDKMGIVFRISGARFTTSASTLKERLYKTALGVI